MGLDAFVERYWVEPIDRDGRRPQPQGGVISAGDGQLDRARYLRGQFVKGQRGDQADDRVWRLGRHDREIRVAELFRRRQAIKATSEPGDLALGGETVKRRRMDAGIERLAGPQRSTPLPEGSEGLRSISGAGHADNSSTINVFLAIFLSIDAGMGTESARTILDVEPRRRPSSVIRGESSMTSRGPSTGGVRAKSDNRIQFDFMLDGVRYRPTIRRPPTTQNLRAARERLVGIRQRIRAGTFFFDHEFPEYRFLGRVIDPSQVRTCNQVFDQFIAHCESRFRRDDLAWVTVNGYRRMLNALWRPRIGALPFLRVDYTMLARIADGYRCSKKTFDNAVSVLRRAFDFGYRNHPHHINPAPGLRGCRMSRKDRLRPDPFRIDEAEQLIAAIREDWGEAQANYDEFRFFTGLRPSEQIALTVSDFDPARGTLRVNKARVAGVDRATTKTGVHRVFELCPRALAVLRRQLALRDQFQRNGRLRHAHLFFSDDGAPIQSIHEPGARWTKTLARLPIRPRRPYCARHSCVSWNLMLGKNPLWVARQHGHSVRTMLEVYAAWADGAVESDVEVIRRAMGINAEGPSTQRPPLLRRLARWLFLGSRTEPTSGNGFSVWHWIWHQERGACT